MAIKWKTIITYPAYILIPAEARDQILAQCAQLQSQGKYTGEFESGSAPGQPNSFFVHRWWWIDEITANQYVEFVELAWPGQQKIVEVLSEEVPD